MKEMGLKNRLLEQASALDLVTEKAQRFVQLQRELRREDGLLAAQIERNARRKQAPGGPVILDATGRPTQSAQAPATLVPAGGGTATESQSSSTRGAISSSGGGGGGGSRVAGGSRSLTSQAGGLRKPEDWVKSHGVEIVVQIPNPYNPKQLLDCKAWDCRQAMGNPDAIFLDPDDLRRVMQVKTISSGRSGGSGGGGGSRVGSPDRPTQFLGDTTDQQLSTGSSERGPSPGKPTRPASAIEPTKREGPTPGEKQIVSTLAQIGLTLQNIQRQGARNDGGAGLRAKGLV